MAHPEEYDVVVLGSGAPGKLLAWTLASQGRRTAVVERRYVGGACHLLWIDGRTGRQQVWTSRMTVVP